MVHCPFYLKGIHGSSLSPHWFCDPEDAISACLMENKNSNVVSWIFWYSYDLVIHLLWQLYQHNYVSPCCLKLKVKTVCMCVHVCENIFVYICMLVCIYICIAEYMCVCAFVPVCIGDRGREKEKIWLVLPLKYTDLITQKLTPKTCMFILTNVNPINLIGKYF